MAHFFTVIPVGGSIPRTTEVTGDPAAYLITDKWDDWFEYSTMYTLRVRDSSGTVHRIGSVKIGQIGMQSEQRRANLEESFNDLNDQFFSVGQDDEYYSELNKLGPYLRDRILRGLRDIALDSDIFDIAIRERVTGVSLFRSVTRRSVQGQFARLAQGGLRLTPYEFSYTAPPSPRSRLEPVHLSFEVVPDSMPPTNIHVLIGRNGVGKTHLLNNMSHALADKQPDPDLVGEFNSGTDDSESELFANLVSVAFSAFDPFEPISNPRDRSEGLPCAYIGLKRIGAKIDSKPVAPKSPESLTREFAASVLVCRSQHSRLSRWRRALQTLQTDPIFGVSDVASLAEEDCDEEALKLEARKKFSKLSSGHKIVLLTITRLVETVEEKTLVMLDEPEAHLHPPLLSAFVRALSDLLVNRNGVAIIATHSPVILQEVPKDCVWIIQRDGRQVRARRPTIETFGENVGVLTREVFSYEVTDAGFHQLLRKAANENDDFERIIHRFDGKLGGEARALIRAIMVNRGDGE